MAENEQPPGKTNPEPTTDSQTHSAGAAETAPRSNWSDEALVAVRGQAPIAIQWGANDDVIIRQERRDEDEDAVIVVRLSNVEALVEKIQAVAEDIRSSR